MFLPDFIGIGGHRCGSSWLWTHIRRHPKVWTPGAKELHFFDRKLQSGAIGPRVSHSAALTRLYYARYFLKSGPRRDLVRGEFTPAYGIMSREEIAFVHAVVPEARLLLIMRDPVEALWSHLRKDFRDQTGAPLEEASDDALLAFARRDAVALRRDYPRMLENWQSAYPAERIKPLFFEDCMADPARHLAEIWGFLGLGDGARYAEAGDLQAKVNARPYSKIPGVLRDFALEEYRPISRRLSEMLGRPTPWPALN